MNCQTCRAEIEELDVGARLSERAGAHLRVCPECGAFHEERQALRRLVGSLGPVHAPPDFDFRLRARLAAAKSNAGQRPMWLSFLASAPAIGIAAAFALLIAGFVIYRQMKSVPKPGELASDTAVQRPEQGNSVQGATQPKIEAAGGSTSENVAKNEDQPVVVEKPQRGGGRINPRRNVAPQTVAKAPQIVSNDSAVLGAGAITPERRQPFNAAATNEVVRLPVRSAAQPVRVALDGRDGARRTVTLEPVVFGSQDLAGRSFSRGGAPQDIW
ncbi:MAG TPA: hypothetical protein VN256_27595 [Pyrinomonadaceae bacterium]|nr:hypothetical protein [Pyrinomonadaceae bacterium]